jgi:thymidylate synthase
MNNLDKQYTDLLQDILDNGVTKQDRTGTGTISVFGRQIRHKMSDGFPLLTTKKMAWKSIVTELLWFLRGDTNIKFLVDNNCHIWDGDAYKNYEKWWKSYSPGGAPIPLSREMFIDRIKTDDEFAKKWGDLGPIYGKQWRSWHTRELMFRSDVVGEPQSLPEFFEVKVPIDQIANLINDLKTNPDSRRLMVNAWNVGELDQMVLPPCHYGFQVYTRELKKLERINIAIEKKLTHETAHLTKDFDYQKWCDEQNIPTRAISLMWNQRSVDTFLGLPFNIASYGLLLEIIAKTVNMVPDELIGNLGDVHLYSNHVDQAKEQIGRELTREERYDLMSSITGHSEENVSTRKKINNFEGNIPETSYHEEWLNSFNIPARTREPYPLPTLNINTEFWPYEGGSCEGPLDAIMVFEAFKNDNFCKCLLEEDIQLSNYQSHPSIKAPLSN